MHIVKFLPLEEYRVFCSGQSSHINIIAFRDFGHCEHALDYVL